MWILNKSDLEKGFKNLYILRHCFKYFCPCPSDPCPLHILLPFQIIGFKPTFATKTFWDRFKFIELPYELNKLEAINKKKCNIYYTISVKRGVAPILFVVCLTFPRKSVPTLVCNWRITMSPNMQVLVFLPLDILNKPK